VISERLRCATRASTVYVAYNSNLENIDEVPLPDGLGGVNQVAGGHLKNDGRNFFVKALYLFRF